MVVSSHFYDYSASNVNDQQTPSWLTSDIWARLRKLPYEGEHTQMNDELTLEGRLLVYNWDDP
jgi:hypothetical protein